MTTTVNRVIALPASVLSAVCLLVPALGLADEAREWLERMTQAVELLNYEGKFVHMHDGGDEVLYIIHRNQDGEVSERIQSMDGAGREIIRHQNKVQCILPDQQTVIIEQTKDINPLVSSLPSYSEELEVHYEIAVRGRIRVAGRMCRQILIRPRDGFRYGYRLWLDEETAMPLKSELRDERERVVERIKFVDIQMRDNIPLAAMEPVTDTTGFRWFRPPPEQASNPATASFRATEVPAGFRLSLSTVRQMAGSRYPVEHLVYSDGIAAVSVFVEDPEAEETESLSGLSRVGSANAFSIKVNDRSVTAVGEVPPKTVESIARSLAPYTEK
jgi:sigma-E factor negative regulatory protein RseB